MTSAYKGKTSEGGEAQRQKKELKVTVRMKTCRLLILFLTNPLLIK